MRTVYLDYNATSPLDPGVRVTLDEASLVTWGNPSSIHHLGRRARALLDDARDRAAAVLRCRPGELVFTSGGTEANNLAVLGTARRRAALGLGRHLVSSAVEHPAVLECHRHLARREGFTLTVVPVDRSGRVDPADVAAALQSDTALVSVMAANNEVGTIQPLAEIGRLCRERRVPLHVDAVQWFGKECFSGIDGLAGELVTFCAHKIHGPKGFGLLYMRSPQLLEPVLHGGAHEHDLRAGTENLPAVLAGVGALEQFVAPPVFQRSTLAPWVERLREAVQALPGAVLLSPSEGCLVNTVAFAVEGTDSLAVLANLDLFGICASSGSACSSGSLTPSHVVRAMGWDEALQSSLVRFSLGRENTAADIDFVCSILPEVVRRSREA